jgi:histidyl-tRNA synthetase
MFHAQYINKRQVHLAASGRSLRTAPAVELVFIAASGKGEDVDTDARVSNRSEQPRAEAFSVQPARGTHDLLPDQTAHWQFIERTAQELLELAGYREIRTPTFEDTQLFKRGVGDTTDIVNKEMYTFEDKSQRSLTLRPEGTAGVVRAYINGGLQRQAPPVKLWYCGPMYRYERAQKGRQRQFHQIGVEVFGSEGPLIDAEVISLALEILEKVGVDDMSLQLNSIGCSECRPSFRQALQDAFKDKLDKLCDDCRDRYQRNPLRMLDCKVETCRQEYVGAPSSLDFLCNPCLAHWQTLLQLLDGLQIKYAINDRLVRGLDYYTRTVFEVLSGHSSLGTQSTICAGGRYDNLVEHFGRQPTAAVGWALGMERLILITQADLPSPPKVFIASNRPEEALKLAVALRRHFVLCELDFPVKGAAARNLGKQIESAHKTGASWTIILGDDEFATQEVTLKDMRTGSQSRQPLNVEVLAEKLLSEEQGTERDLP